MKSLGIATLPLRFVLVFLAAGSQAISAEHGDHSQEHGSRAQETAEDSTLLQTVDAPRQSDVPQDANESESNRLRLPEAPEIEFAHGLQVSSVAFGPNSRYLASADYRRGVRLWDLKLRKQAWNALMSIIGSVDEEGVALAFTNDGKRLLFISNCRDPLVLDVSTGKVLRTLGKAERSAVFADAVSTCRIGDTPALVTASGGDLHFWHSATEREFKTLKGAGENLNSLHVARDGKRIALGLRSGRAVVRELPSGRILLDEQQSRFRLHAVALSPLGDLLVATSSERMTGWQVDDKKHLWSIEENCYSLAISTDGRTIAYGRQGQVILRDVRTGEIVSATPYGASNYAVAFNADGSAVATGGGDGSVAVWRLGTGNTRD